MCVGGCKTLLSLRQNFSFSHWNGGPSGWDFSVPLSTNDGFYLCHMGKNSRNSDLVWDNVNSCIFFYNEGTCIQQGLHDTLH